MRRDSSGSRGWAEPTAQNRRHSRPCAKRTRGLRAAAIIPRERCAPRLMMTAIAAAERRFVSVTSLTERLTEAVQAALAAAGLPSVAECAWEVPRQSEHGDYATNVAMVLARAAKKAPRQIAEAIVTHFPPRPEVARLEVAGPGFLNVFLAPAWCAGALRSILEAGADYGRGDDQAGQRIRLEFVSANPTGPLVIVNARAAAIGDALARLLSAQGAQVTTDYYVNDAGTQFEALARSDRKSTRLNSSHLGISYAVFCL